MTVPIVRKTTLHYTLHKSHHVTPDKGTAFQLVEDALQEAFLSDLFKGATSQILGRTVTSMPVKQSGIALLDPTQTTRANCTASCVITRHLVSAIQGMAEF